MYSIYALVDPRDQGIRYVGMSQDVWRRYAMHLLISSKTQKNAWIQELRRVNLSPTLTILETVETKNDASKQETYWIKYYLGLNAPLTNMNKTDRPVTPAHKKTYGQIEEMEAIFKQEGWTVHRRKRRTHTYIYAAKRNGLKVEEVYVAPLSKLDSMSPEKLIEFLQEKTSLLKK